MALLIPSKKSEKEEHSYLAGDCHHFAIALNRLTGAPLVSFHKDYLLREEERVGDEPEDMYWSEHAHAAVLVSPSVVVDCEGVRVIESCNLLFFGTNLSDESPSEVRMTEFGNREEDLASNYADFDENLIKKAMKDAQRWGCDLLVQKMMNAQKRVEKGVSFEQNC